MLVYVNNKLKTLISINMQIWYQNPWINHRTHPNHSNSSYKAAIIPIKTAIKVIILYLMVVLVVLVIMVCKWWMGRCWLRSSYNNRYLWCSTRWWCSSSSSSLYMVAISIIYHLKVVQPYYRWIQWMVTVTMAKNRMCINNLSWQIRNT